MSSLSSLIFCCVGFAATCSKEGLSLCSYRLCDPSEKHIYKTSPLFGKYFAVDKTGTIQIGDPVYKIIWE